MKIPGIWRTVVLPVVRSWSRRAHDRGSDHSIISVLTQYHVKVSYRDSFLDALTMYTFSSMETAGNIMAEAYYEKGDVCIMWMIERWSNRSFYKKNKKAAAAKVIGALTKIALAAPVETFFIRDLGFLSKEGSLNTPGRHFEPITVMLFVDLKKGAENHFRSINDILLSVFLNEPGVLAFQLSQLSYHRTRFVVYKKFRNWDAFRYHLRDPVLEPVIKFLQASLKEPPLEKGYHQLIQFAPVQ